MEFDWMWKSILIFVGGTLLLRVAGRKSISQMTLAQTVIMVGIGSLLIQPVAGENIWVTLGVGGILVLTLVFMEFAQLKSDAIEKFITGRSKALIQNGTIDQKNLKKLRLTIDQLEMQLRQNNVTKISDVEYATLEPNGQLGFVLKEEVQPVTKQELWKLSRDIQQLKDLMNSRLPHVKLITELADPEQRNDASESRESQMQINKQQNIFSEVATNLHDPPPPKQLQ